MHHCLFDSTAENIYHTATIKRGFEQLCSFAYLPRRRRRRRLPSWLPIWPACLPSRPCVRRRAVCASDNTAKLEATDGTNAFLFATSARRHFVYLRLQSRIGASSVSA